MRAYTIPFSRSGHPSAARHPPPPPSSDLAAALPALRAPAGLRARNFSAGPLAALSALLSAAPAPPHPCGGPAVLALCHAVLAVPTPTSVLPHGRIVLGPPRRSCKRPVPCDTRLNALTGTHTLRTQTYTHLHSYLLAQSSPLAQASCPSGHTHTNSDTRTGPPCPSLPAAALCYKTGENSRVYARLCGRWTDEDGHGRWKARLKLKNALLSTGQAAWGSGMIRCRKRCHKR